MKTKIGLALGGVLIAAVGCVSTVNDRTTAAVPFVKDKLESRYDRPVEPVFAAAKQVVKEMGALVREGTIYTDQNNLAKIVEGKINQRSIWIRITAVDPKITSVIVQARTQGGGTDIPLVAQIKEKIALALAAGQ